MGNDLVTKTPLEMPVKGREKPLTVYDVVRRMRK